MIRYLNMSQCITLYSGFKSIISSGFSDNVQSKGKLLVKSHHVINVKEILLGNNSQINGHVIASVTLHPYLVKLVVSLI